MAQTLNIDNLIEEAVKAVPGELQNDLRDWLRRAQTGKLSEVSRETAEKVQELWRAFDNAANQVERKLQQ
jgi:hypothetical protein